ncbi:polyketide synthase dehydratase domain-containing protein [Streptomyces sp. FXJ1.4098]|nr:polyketide synthase dehydratase domain-containing protein [Streptomyces sp. FXJ1.4098]
MPAVGGGRLFTGRLSVDAQPWLADHIIGDTVLLPGTAVAELALWAGRHVGLDHVADLALEVPLALPRGGGLRVQLAVDAPDSSGDRGFGLYTQPEGSADDVWTRHAGGTLTAVRTASAEELTVWPPAGPRNWTPMALTRNSRRPVCATGRPSRAARGVAARRGGVRRGPAARGRRR